MNGDTTHDRANGRIAEDMETLPQTYHSGTEMFLVGLHVIDQALTYISVAYYNDKIHSCNVSLPRLFISG